MSQFAASQPAILDLIGRAKSAGWAFEQSGGQVRVFWAGEATPSQTALALAEELKNARESVKQALLEGQKPVYQAAKAENFFEPTPQNGCTIAQPPLVNITSDEGLCSGVLHNPCTRAQPVQVTLADLRSDHTLLDTASAVQAALPVLLAAPVLGLDTETTGLDPYKDRVRLIQLATSESVYILDAFKVSPSVLRPVLESESVKVIHNAAFDLKFLLANGLVVRNVYDTLLADQVLRNSRYPRKLSELCSEHLRIALDKSEQRSDFSGALSERQLAYAAKDAAVLIPLHQALTSMIQGAKLERCLSLENRAVPAIAWLEYSGVAFDTEAWRRLADGALSEKLRLEDELTAMAQDALGNNNLFGRAVNWESATQVKDTLQALGLDVPNTAEDVLSGLLDKHPIVAKLLSHREVTKRCGTYGLNVLGDVHPVTGRIHADWRQIGAESGRMACSKPNLQNVPRTPAYRACFVAPPGRALVKADYSQIELRIAAEIAGDKKMLEAYQRGEDLHVLTAQAILGKSDVSKDDRQIAKSANFGLLYGMGAAGFQQYARNNYGVDVSLEDATELRNKFFRAYPGLRAWHRRQLDGAVDIRTVCGRRRAKVQKFTEKLNTPVQGTGADGMKAALALLWETRDHCPSAFPVLAVHDEIVVECDIDEAERAKAWLVETMERAMSNFVRKVPVVVEAEAMRDWSGRELTDDNDLSGACSMCGAEVYAYDEHGNGFCEEHVTGGR